MSRRVFVKSEELDCICARINPVQCVRPVVDRQGVDTRVVPVNY